MIYLLLIGSIQLPPGAPDLSLFGIPVLAGRLVFAVIWQARPSEAGRVGGKSWPGCHPAPSRHPLQTRSPAPPGAVHPRGDPAGSEKVTRAQSPSSSGRQAMESVHLQMARGLLKMDFFFFFFMRRKTPPALYQLEAKITCFGNHYLAIRASAH